tara:strand:+ start:17235 stop:18464 length:1230 start_codon:yes stop_codon:yes gene_type:complete
MNFTEFLEEARQDKNLHLEHLEDNVLNRGVTGARESINFLQSLRDMLAGSSTSKINVTTKWDGAPAVFAGINPKNGKFFVGTKSVFNRAPKLNYTDRDIDRNHPSGGLNEKLKVALAFLPKLGIKGVLQGDMMFTKGDIKKEQIDGEKYITFQPNTIVYAVPESTPLAKTMQAAQLGIVFHTSYSGRSLDTMKPSFNIDIGRLKPTKDIWFRDASFVNASGTATFTEAETKQITNILSQAGKTLQKINSLVLNRLSVNDKILGEIKIFNNQMVRQGQKIRNTSTHTVNLIRYVENKLNKEIIKAKREDTKKKRQKEKNEVMRFLRGSARQLIEIFNLMNSIVESKTIIIRKLQEMRQVTNTFVRTDDGFRITNPEGFVAVDKLSGGALKLVDRLEFSHQNFTAKKTWDK